MFREWFSASSAAGYLLPALSLVCQPSDCGSAENDHMYALLTFYIVVNSKHNFALILCIRYNEFYICLTNRLTPVLWIRFSDDIIRSFEKINGSDKRCRL